MAAILCPRCHKIVSSEAETCPHCGQRKPGLWGATATIRKLGLQLNFPHLITVFCGVLYLLALLLDPSAIFQTQGLMQILSPSLEASIKLGVTGTRPVTYGWWWTLITAIYLHGGLLHIFFNMMWVRQLGPVVEELFGPFRLFAIFTIAGITGFIASTLAGHAFTLGASGSIFGLLAAAIAYGRRAGSQLFTRQFLQWAVLLFIMGFVMPGVDNWAHGGGFVGGYAAAYVFSRSSEREGLGAYLVGGLCLLATVGAFVLQFIAVFL
ncbi:MAG: rhomboid family intramembrane serine protease [Gemmatimonadetes bacterium]|nr:rhomboid family intramembrane serine protease [Gemmatimonadota bacterium]